MAWCASFARRRLSARRDQPWIIPSWNDDYERSGIGLGAVERFVSEGARVFITGRRERELNLAVAEIGGACGQIDGGSAPGGRPPGPPTL